MKSLSKQVQRVGVSLVGRLDPATGQFKLLILPPGLFKAGLFRGGGDIVRNTSVTPDGNFVLANSLTNEVTLVRIAK